MNNNLETKPFSILYAEDDSLIREAYTKHLKSIFQIVYDTCDGKEAFEVYTANKPDILLFDINMPYINGLDLSEKIRKTDKDVKIIILTAHLDESKLLQAIPLGLVNYLKKPVKRQELTDILYKTIAELERKNAHIIALTKTLTWDIKKELFVDEDKKIHLTKNEIILMNILTSKSKQNYSLNDLLEAFWLHGVQQDMTENSIRNIIKRLKQKLPEGTIGNHYGVGYQLCALK